MGIYTRDQIQYANMIQNAMQNRARSIEREGDRIAKIGELYGNAFNKVGQSLHDADMEVARQRWREQEAEEQRNFQRTEAERRALEQMEAQRAQREFQRIEAEKRAREQIAAQQSQRDWLSEQNRLQRETTENIAKENAALSRADKELEWTKFYNKALNVLRNLKAQSVKDPNNLQLKLDLEQAEEDVKFYGKKLGINDPTPSTPSTPQTPQTPPPADQRDSWSNDDLVKNTRELLSGTWTNDAKSKSLDLASRIKDDAIKNQLMTEISKKGTTVEEKGYARAAEDAAANRQFKANGNFDNKKYKVKYVNGEASLVRK